MTEANRVSIIGSGYLWATTMQFLQKICRSMGILGKTSWSGSHVRARTDINEDGGACQPHGGLMRRPQFSGNACWL